MKEGFKRHSIVVLDGIMQLLQNYFLLISAFYLVMTYINMFYPCFTVVLYNDALVPRQFWSVLGIIQYVLPLIVLLQIEVPAKIYLYWLIYPVFMYSWVPEIEKAAKLWRKHRSIFFDGDYRRLL